MILKWVIVAVLYVDNVPINSKIFTLDPADYKTAGDCKALADQIMKDGKEMGHTIWAKCMEVDYKPTAKPTPKDKKSEVNS